MRRIVLTVLASAAFFVASAQTMNVRMGSIVHAHHAANVGDITPDGNGRISLGRVAYDVNNIDDIVINHDEVADNTVLVHYEGDNAKVTVAGNVAPFITARVKGAHVSVVADAALQQEVTYALSGTTANGSFYMDAEIKSTLMLDAVNIINPDSAAINIACGKRIDVVLADGTASVLSDGLRAVDDGSDAHKACFYVNGHPEFSGSGNLTITGNVKHGFASDEYCRLKQSTGAITITSAKSDGLHIGQYLQVEGGHVEVTAEGDGIDVGAKKDNTLEHNGEVLLDGGELVIKSVGAACKALKSDADVLVTAGTHVFTAAGDAVYTTELSSAAALKTDGRYVQQGGNVMLTATGGGGKAMNVTKAVAVSGGKLTAVSTGDVVKMNGDDTKPHAIKCDQTITVSGGDVRVAASASKGVAFKTDFDVIFTGGTVMGIGGKASTVSPKSTLTVKSTDGIKISAGTTYTYNGVSFDIPAVYSNSNAYVVTAK